MINRISVCIGIGALGLGMIGMGGPLKPVGVQVAEKTVQPIQARRLLSPRRFRCILVGDSQTTEPSATRIRTQDHRWDAPIVGELITVGSSSVGFLVNNSNAGISGLSYSNIDMNSGWPDGGPADFFAALASQWQCNGDIEAPGSRIGRYRLRFGGNNVNAPWDEHWGIGNALVAKIAVRTGPRSVGAIQTRAERGGVSSVSARTIHKLNKTQGIQIIEQLIPNDFQPTGDDVGVGIYLPAGSVENPGEVLQILGVVIERVDEFGDSLPGTVIGYQGRGGWGIDDHLEKVSFASRVALVEMVEAEFVMIMLGHNREPGGSKAIMPSMMQLVAQWESAFAATGRRRPTVIYVTPWAIFSKSASPYLIEVESVMRDLSRSNRQDVHLSYLPRFNYIRPDIFNPKRYQLDNANVHPGDIPSAVNLSEDLYQMLFFPSWLID